MEKSIVFNLSENSNNGFKMEVINTGMVVGKNICEHYSMLAIDTKMYSKLYNLALDVVDNKVREGGELTDAETELLFDTEVEHNIWIPNVFVDSTISILGVDVKIKPKHLDDVENFKKVTNKALVDMINYKKGIKMAKIVINFDFVSGNEISYVEGVAKFMSGIGFETNCLDFFQFDSLVQYGDVVVMKKDGSYISLAELLVNENNEYTPKEIRVSHNVRKMLVAGSIDFKTKTKKESKSKIEYGLLIKQRPGHGNAVGVTLIPEELVLGKNLCTCCYTKLDNNNELVKAFIRATESVEIPNPKFNNNVDVWIANELLNQVIVYGRTEYLFNSLEKLQADKDLTELSDEEQSKLKNNNATNTFVNNRISKAKLNTVDENLELFKDALLNVKLEPTNAAVIQILPNQTLDSTIDDIKSMVVETFNAKAFFMFKLGSDVYILTINGTPFFSAGVARDLVKNIDNEVTVYYVSEFKKIPAFIGRMEKSLTDMFGEKDLSLLGYPSITNATELTNLLKQKYMDFTTMFNTEGATEKEAGDSLRKDKDLSRKVPTTNVMSPIKGYPSHAKISPITNGSCILVDIEAVFAFSNIDSLLSHAEHLDFEVMKINNRYNKDVQELITDSYDRLYSSHGDNGSKVKFYYTPRFIVAHARNNPYVNKIKFKTLTKSK